jgi:ATP-binding cassette, subfamily B, multidrug efflux pump
VLRRLETIIDATRTPDGVAPPDGLWRFFWHFTRQAKGLFAVLLVLSTLAALVEVSIPWLIGHLVEHLARNAPQTFFAEAWTTLVLLAVMILFVRPLVFIVQRMVNNQAIIPPFTTLVRWQSHWHVVRQSLTFFQNDFAGRIANRVMQVGSAVREVAVAAIRSVLQLVTLGVASTGLLLAYDWRLALPMFAWMIAYPALLVWSVPRQRERARKASEMRSIVTGKVVDGYTNILTLKLFARTRDEDQHVRESMNALNEAFIRQQRLATLFTALLLALNALLLASTIATAILLWQAGQIGIGTVAMVLPLVGQIIAMSGWVSFEIAGIFENVGVIQESMQSVAKPLTMQDEPGANELAVPKGAIAFNAVGFGYGQSRQVIDRISLDVAPGEKVGIVGRSGAGKTTLMNLLLRFHDVESGSIAIDGQDIRHVTQESLRAAISVVTQDTSLLHRSIRENILYGKRSAGDAAMIDAAERAEAHGFIETLEDWQGRKGYDAHVGERGVKLSGGQRQRIAIARVILKDAPILVLDEATSALDSEVEAAIQASLSELMRDKTVIAIAHRLSTLQIMDRLVVIDQGRILEQGTHAELLEKGGLYADLWRRQSGGFIADDDAEGEEAAPTSSKLAAE